MPEHDTGPDPCGALGPSLYLCDLPEAHDELAHAHERTDIYGNVLESFEWLGDYSLPPNPGPFDTEPF